MLIFGVNYYIKSSKKVLQEVKSAVSKDQNSVQSRKNLLSGLVFFIIVFSYLGYAFFSKRG